MSVSVSEQVYRALAFHTVIRDFKSGKYRVRNLDFDARKEISNATGRINMRVGGFITASSYNGAATTDAIVTIKSSVSCLCVRVRGDAKSSFANILRHVLVEIQAPDHVIETLHRAYSRNYTDVNKRTIIDSVFADLENHILTMCP